jgi:hypothetical protein
MKSLLVVVLACTLTFTACSAAWVTTLDTIIAAAAPALINILEIVAVSKGQPVNATLVAKINTDAGTLKTLASDFANASSTAGPGICQQLSAAVSTYEGDENEVLQVAQVVDPNTQTKIDLLTNLVAGTVQAVTAVIPSCQTPAALLSFRTGITVGGAVQMKAQNFVKTYNNLLTSPTGNTAVDLLTPKLKIHEHSKLVRYLSLGHLQ